MNKYFKTQPPHATHYFCQMEGVKETLVISDYQNGRWGRNVMQNESVKEALKDTPEASILPLTEDEFTKAANEANKFINPEIEK